MPRPRTLPRLLARAAWHRRSWLAASGICLIAGTVAGWSLRPAPERAVTEARERPPSDADGIEGVVLVDRGGLRAGEIVPVLAQSLAPSVPVGDARYHQLLVGGEWVTGDAIAVREQPEGALRGYNVSFEGTDLDGDGAPDRLWLGARESVEIDTERDRVDGTLVFEGSGGTRTLPLGSSDGWGSAQRLQQAQLRDLVGTPEPELLVVLDTDTCEVGPTGRRLVVITFVSGAPVIAIEHEVNDPSLVGLAQYEVGSVRVRGREILARTVVHAPTCPEDDDDARCIRVRVERWLGGEHTTSDEPLRSTDGTVVTRATGLPGLDELPARFRLADGRWIEGDAIAEEPYARALREWGTDELYWRNWVVIE